MRGSGVSWSVCLGFVALSSCALDRAPGQNVERDAGSSTDGCVATAEVCNSLDDDCDTRVDEGIDVTSDVMNCGVCGRACPTAANGTPSCESGECGFACRDDFADCDGVLDNGCEALLVDAANCGACGNACLDPTPLCARGGGGITCVGMCPDTNPTLCGATCVDTMTDALNCGECGNECGMPGTLGSCVDGECVLECEDGFGDCDGDPDNGCEQTLDSVDHCGGCAVACTQPNATATCAGEACAVASCDPGFADCGGADDGCETTLGTDDDCSACGDACRGFPNARTASCVDSACEISECRGTFDDCDGVASNGCEADTMRSTMHCGGCGMPCGGSEMCVSGSCQPAIVQVEAGRAHTCALGADGSVWCWGSDSNGQLGNSGGSTDTPDAVMGIDDAVALTVGDYHTCVIRSGGSVWCWGENARLQLGRTTGATDQPGMVEGIDDATAISGGAQFTCALRSDERIWCWGENHRSQLGFVGANTANVTLVSGTSAATGLDCGDNHCCALRTAADDVYCWGQNNNGQLGRGSTSTSEASPRRIHRGADALSCGGSFCCLGDDGAVLCWGRGSNGRLGTGDSTSVLEPGPMVIDEDDVPLDGVADLSCGGTFACARLMDDQVVCWGRGAYGQLGNGSTATRAFAVTSALAAERASGAVSAGLNHACVPVASGVMCWGSGGDGTLGNGDDSDQTTPVFVSF